MERIILTKKEFKEAMEVLNRAAKDDTRPILQGINFNTNKVVALDGHRLAIREFKSFNLKDSYTILAGDLKAIKSLIKGSVESIEIEFNKDDATFYLLDREKITIEEKNIRLLPGSYISYNSLIPAEFEKNFILDNKKILDIIKPLKKNAQILLSFMDDELKIFRMESKEYHLIGTIETKKKINEEFKIAINSTYLKEAIKDYKDMFRINFNKSIDPIVIKNNNKLDLILPIKIFN